MGAKSSKSMPWDTLIARTSSIPPRTVGIIIVALVAVVIIVFQFVWPSINSEALDLSSDSSKQEQTEGITAKQICVHVTGHVVSPGLVYLDANSRVYDAIEASGGFLEDANAQTLNLARVLIDGEQIVVPGINETQGESAGSSTTSSAFVGSRLNINQASQEDFETLSGIGPSTAAKIVADREANGPFNSVQDLMRVSGIGEKKFASLEPYICVG